MIVHINHISPTKSKTGKKSQLGELASLVTGSLVDLVEGGQLDARIAPSLRIHLDWIQYKTNFRDPVIVRRTTDSHGKALALAEVAIDLRQANAADLPMQLERAIKSVNPNGVTDDGRFYLDEYRPYRDCMIWQFNSLFWSHLAEWEAASGRGFEAALPSGQSDGNRYESVISSVEEFWKLLKDMDGKGQLPPEIPALEIGVGSGAHAAVFMDCFKDYDAQQGTNYYAKLQYILGDYSADTLDRAVQAMSQHAGHVSAAPLDALNPFKTLSAYRFKVMYVHLTNVYDNLPFDDHHPSRRRPCLARGARAYLSAAAGRTAQPPISVSRAKNSRPSSRACSRTGHEAVFPGQRRGTGVLAQPVGLLQARRTAARARRPRRGARAAGAELVASRRSAGGSP